MKRFTTMFFMEIFCLALSIPAGYGNYNAEIYDNAQTFLTEEYSQKNEIRIYYNQQDENLPETVTKVVADKATFDKAFESFPQEVDFDKKVVILYFYRDIYWSRSCHVKSIENHDGKIEITVNQKKEGCFFKKDGAPPIKRCLAVVMDKTEINTVDFVIYY